jgi:hypothetical protein
VGLLLAANETDVDPERVLHRRAADIYADTVMLVEKVENVGERRRLEEKLKQLREGLEQTAGRDGVCLSEGYPNSLACPFLITIELHSQSHLLQY